MPEDINREILSKISEADVSKEVKQFLRDVLILELKNFEEGQWRYGKEYDARIKKHAARYDPKGDP